MSRTIYTAQDWRDTLLAVGTDFAKVVLAAKATHVGLDAVQLLAWDDQHLQTGTPVARDRYAVREEVSKASARMTIKRADVDAARMAGADAAFSRLLTKFAAQRTETEAERIARIASAGRWRWKTARELMDAAEGRDRERTKDTGAA